MTTAASPGPLDVAWPELRVDPVRAAAYAAALEGLDPAAVAAVSDSLRRDGRPLPTPGILRAAVLARGARPVVAAPPPPRFPARDAAVVPDGRGRTVAMAVCAASALVMFLSVGGPWAHIVTGEDVRGSESGAGALVGAAGLAGLAAAAIGGLYIRRRRSGALLLQAFMFLAVVTMVALASAAHALWQIWDSWALTVSPAFWPSLAATAVGSGAAITGVVLTWPAASRRARAWTVGVAAALVLAGGAFVAVAVLTYDGPAPGTPAAARVEYAHVMNDMTEGAVRSARAMQDAIAARDLDGLLDALQAQGRAADDARSDLVAGDELNRPPYRRHVVALAAALGRTGRLVDAGVARMKMGIPPSAADIRALDAADADAMAADAALRRSLGLPALPPAAP